MRKDPEIEDLVAALTDMLARLDDHVDTTQLHLLGESHKLEAELIFDDQVHADAAGIALRTHGLTVVPRPDWDDGETETAWLMARTIAADVHAFAEQIQTIIAPHDGLLWSFGYGWSRNQHPSGVADEEQVERAELLQ